MPRSVFPAAILLALCAANASAQTVLPAKPVGDSPTVATAKARLLPGVQPNGAIQLPNQWSLRPCGKQTEVGDFPVNMALHPSGRWLAVLHAGFGDHEIMILDTKLHQRVSRVTLGQTFYGLCFAPDGRTLYASGGEFEVVHSFSFDEGLLSNHHELRMVDVKEKFIPGGLAVDPTGKTLCVAGTWGGAVCIVPLAEPDKHTRVPLGAETYPYACVIDRKSQRLYVSLWNRAGVVVIDLNEKKILATWRTELNPTEMVLSPGDKRLFVACANSTKVCEIETATGKNLQTIACSLYVTPLPGNTPNSLALSPDGELLFVANADSNNVAAFNVAAPGEAKPLGFIPVGWYPTSVRFDADTRHLFVANGKGLLPKANPQGPNPNLPPGQKTTRQYIGGLFHGTVSLIDLPTPTRMSELTKEAYACTPLHARSEASAAARPNNPIPAMLGDPSPIKHCIYIIKENRTYDQVFGDMKQGNGDASLCIFPEHVTPNHHKLSRKFVLLDNFYVDGEVSADGHQWTMGAYATDFVEKVWPLSYRGSVHEKLPYPSEGGFVLSHPANGYLWDRCVEAKLDFRDYGEWIANGKTLNDPGVARLKTLEGHFDPRYRGFDLNYPDQKRADRFIEDFTKYDKQGQVPRLIVIHLPNDHTAGSSVGMRTPTAYVADNDLALGRIVEAVSKSSIWKETAIFVVEDDAQNGSDHVDAHRSVALVISPFTTHGKVDSSMYSTTSLLRTMELILGLKPMSQFDAAAAPMYASFQPTADATPYEHEAAHVDLEEKSTRAAWGAKLSASFDLTREDRVDDLLLNEVVWRSVRGADSPMPAPVRAAFVLPHAKDVDGDDD